MLTVSGTPTSATRHLQRYVDRYHDQQQHHADRLQHHGQHAGRGVPAHAESEFAGIGVDGQSYTGYINASSGVSPYTWTIGGNSVGSSGYSLGNGTLAAHSSGGNTLSISGTPSSTGTVTLTNVKVTDAANSNASNTYTITVNATQPLTITIGDVPQGMVNMPYTFGDLNITGGVSPYTIAYSNLPAGLQQSSTNSYQVVGTPTGSGTTVTVKVTDSATLAECRRAQPLACRWWPRRSRE